MENFTEETREFAATIFDFLEQKYGEIPPTFNHSIKILLVNYDLWVQAKDDIMSRGALIPGTKGEMKKNPSLKIFTDSQIYVINQLKEFGLTPRALKSLNKNDEKEPEHDSGDLMKILETL